MDDRLISKFIAAEKAWQRKTLNDYLDEQDICNEGCIDRAIEEDKDVDVDTVVCDCEDYFHEPDID
jgi:hypothetical protein